MAPAGRQGGILTTIAVCCTGAVGANPTGADTRAGILAFVAGIVLTILICGSVAILADIRDVLRKRGGRSASGS